MSEKINTLYSSIEKLDCETLLGEEWKDIEDFEKSYQVSNLGRVRSLPRQSGDRFIRGKILKLGDNQNGYKLVILRKDNKSHAKLIHRLVASSFLGKSSLHVDHINGVKDDNRLINLRYCTPRENNHFKVLRTKDYIGVSKLSKTSKWVSSIGIEGVSYTIGIFNTLEEGIEAYNNALHEWEVLGEKPKYKKRVPSSKYKGVYKRQETGKWETSITINKKVYNLGVYESEEDARKAREEAETNYETKGELPNYKNPKCVSQKYKYLSIKNNKWQASIK